MKSYQKHLESTLAPGAAAPSIRKPVFRSSAIFPVRVDASTDTRITFLGYWLIKRDIPEVALLCTLRDEKGTILQRRSQTINAAQSFSIEIRAELAQIGRANEPFLGSIELEIFSTRDLVFPYPAFVICYHGEGFSTAVHTVGRIYNDADDWKENDESRVAESGFDVYGAAGIEPFFAFTNGPFPDPNPVVSCSFVRGDGGTFDADIHLAALAPYETRWVRFREQIDLARALGDGPGTVKIKHAFQGFYPRFVAGNTQSSPASMSVTHTYYDCSTSNRPADYWSVPHDGYHDCGILVPVFADRDLFTELVVYPLISPSVFVLSVDLRDANGERVAHFPDLLRVDTHGLPHHRIRLDKLLAQAGLSPEKAFGAYITARWVEGSRVPTRLKLGLNVGYSARPVRLPCNICFAPQLGNPAVERKSGTFRWAPILNVGRSVLVLTQASPAHDYARDAQVEVQFFRESDGRVLERRLVLPPFGHARIDTAEDPELAAFINGKTGWMSARSDNPWLGGWYFDFHESGAVAADHFF